MSQVFAAPELQDDAALAAHRKRSMFFLCLAVAGVSFTMMVQMGLNANFLVEDIGINGQQMGRIEAARETCGIIAFAVLAVLSGFAEPLVGAAMLALMGLGLGSYAFVPKEYTWVILLSLVWSQGLHVWMPLPSSMAMGLAEKGRTGFRLGQLSAAGSVGSFLGLGVAFILNQMHFPMRPMYLVAGGASILAALACLGIPNRIKTPGPKLVFRKKYSLYYLLSFLEGWRKQIFLSFSAFLLVKVYHVPLATMLGLWAAVQVLVYFSSPRVGKLIDRIGERKILFFYYTIMICIFVGYAFLPSWQSNQAKAVQIRTVLLYSLFVLDGAFFIFATALTTYVNRIAPQNEHTATLSVGVAMNHVAAVTMPFVGGILWEYNPMWTFLIGTVAAILSIVATSFIPRRTELAPGGEPLSAPGKSADGQSPAPYKPIDEEY